MFVNKNIFCNAPWHEIHIWHNGDYGYCCQRYDKPYDENFRVGQKPNDIPNPFNIKKMGIKEWYDSEPMRKSRLEFLGQQRPSACNGCWSSEDHGSSSKRTRSNQRSVIFQENFEDSLLQSPDFKHFKQAHDNNGQYGELPVDLHIDLGNYCNLSCKMCYPQGSTKIATQYKKWNILEDESLLGANWTADKETWNKFLDDVAELPRISSIHFMGGETLIQKQFLEFIDFMIDRGRVDYRISFVTNGTTFDQKLIDKLSKFEAVGIEISIETVDRSNEYIRQGTVNETVLDNIDRYLNLKHDNISFIVRPTLSLLSIRDFHGLLRYCLKKKLLIKSLVLQAPVSQRIDVLPLEIRQGMIKPYQDLLEELDDLKFDHVDINENDGANYQEMVKRHAELAIELLRKDDHARQKELLGECVNWMDRWDKVQNLNALEIYSELSDILKKGGYGQL